MVEMPENYQVRKLVDILFVFHRCVFRFSLQKCIYEIDSCPGPVVLLQGKGGGCCTQGELYLLGPGQHFERRGVLCGVEELYQMTDTL